MKTRKGWRLGWWGGWVILLSRSGVMTCYLIERKMFLALSEGPD